MITQPEISVEFRTNGVSYTAHVIITMEAVSEDRDEIRDEVMTTLREMLTGGPYEVKMTVIDESGMPNGHG